MALKNQAHLEIDEGRYAAAELAAQEAVDVGLRTLGDEHPETVAALLMRAYVYQYSREPDAALRAAESAYDHARPVYRDAPRHPRTIEGRLLYGRALGEAGDSRRAAWKSSRRPSATRRKCSGRRAAWSGSTRMPLAGIASWRPVRSPRRSKTAARRSTSSRNTPRPQSFRYAAAIHQRGAALLAARRADEALPDCTYATEMLRQTLPAGHEITRWFQADHALALARAGRHREAQELVEALAARAGIAAGRVGEQGAVHHGRRQAARWRRAGALRFQQQALQIDRARPSAERDRMRALTEAGLALLDLAKPDQAAALARAGADAVPSGCSSRRRPTAPTSWRVSRAPGAPPMRGARAAHRAARGDPRIVRRISRLGRRGEVVLAEVAERGEEHGHRSGHVQRLARHVVGDVAREHPDRMSELTFWCTK